MNAKTTISRILFIAIWLCIGGGMLTLLLAAISKKNKGHCKNYQITISGAHNHFFIDQKDVEQFLMKSANGNIKDRLVASFNLYELEQKLKQNVWIDDAELYFDNQDILHVTVSEKEPVARIFTADGYSFYIDSLGRKLPLSDKLSARVPVFTNFPDKEMRSFKDSILLNDVKIIANFIVNNPFWMSQVAQIDITPERKFEMVPLIGNHLVKLGTGENISQKFRRLMIFYEQVLSKTGFDKYKVINVQYRGQVVASNNTGDTRVDSARLRKNVEKLFQQAKSMQEVVLVNANSPGPASADMKIINPVNPGKKSNPKPVKPVLPKPKEKKGNNSKRAEKKKEPKAVMPKKPEEDANGGYN